MSAGCAWLGQKNRKVKIFRMHNSSIIKFLGSGLTVLALAATAWFFLAPSEPSRNSIFADALAAARGIESAAERTILLTSIAAAQGNQALFAEAIETVREIEDSENRLWAQQFVASAQAGQQTSTYGPLFNQTTTALSEIAVAQAENGQFAMALEEARRNDDSLSRMFALNDIAVAQALAGQFAEALVTARGIEDVNVRSTAHRRIAQAQAQAGMFDEALATARGIEVADRRIMALIDIASAMPEE